jgi:monoamine oxidase
MAVRMSDMRGIGISNPQQEQSQDNGNMKVLIVGAGAAGMYAAHLLATKGVEVVVLEATAIHGGRVRPLENFANFPLELGAEEIHGENSVYYEMVKQSGADIIGEETEDYYYIGNELLDREEAEENKDFIEAIDFIDAIQDYSGQDISLADYLKNEEIDESVYHIINAEVANEHGTSAERIGMAGLALEAQIWAAGEENFMLTDRSHLSIIEENCKDILEKINYNQVVKSIDYSENLVSVGTQDGANYTANAVIITVPITILKAGAINFYPALPTNKQNAIQKIGMDAGMKIILKFKTPFWQPNTGSIFGKLIPEYWVSSEGRSKEEYVLTALVNGKNAEYLSQQGEDATNLIISELDTIFGNKLPSSSLEKSYIMDWSKEPFIKGAYSYDTVGIGESRKILATSLDGMVFFAGEATCTNGHHASIHGAMESAKIAVDEFLGMVS